MSGAKPRYGRIGWTELDIADTDAEAAQRFYGELLGWSFEPRERSWLARRDAEPVASIRRRGAASAGGATPSWCPFVLLDDVEAAVSRAVAAGACRSDQDLAGSVVASTLLTDADGASFALAVSAEVDGCAVRLNAPGALAWNELWTPDLARAAAVYGATCGWRAQPGPPSGGAPYTLFANRDERWTHGGVRVLPVRPALWLAYFEVDDCRASSRCAEHLGARVTAAPTRIPGVGWVATLLDPTGASFGLMESEASS